MKKLDFKKNVYELTEEYPELINILKNYGFLGIANPVIRNTLGRITTIPEACKKQGKDLDEFVKKLKEEGFEV